jgi:hypothetical protein
LIDLPGLREHPDYREGDIDLALRLLDFLVDNPNFKKDSEMLRSAIIRLGLIPARGLGPSIDLLRGSFGVNGDIYYRNLAKVLAPDVFARINLLQCEETVADNIFNSDELKEIIWSYILEGDARATRPR